MTDFTNLPDRALSIRQPWAWAILNAGKRIENRPQRWKYRGPICIHASLGGDAGEHLMAMIEIKRATDGAANVPDRYQIERGGIIGTAEIVDVVTESDSPWFFGPYGYVLDNVRPHPFIPVKGALGLFRWKEKL